MKLKPQIKYIFLLLVMAYGMSGFGQRFNFKNFNSESGLTNTTILGIHQLPNGTMWLGTNEGGINTFDGFAFDTITKDNGLVDNVVYDFCPEANGDIWVSTNNGVSLWSDGDFDSIMPIDSTVNSRVFKTFIDSKNEKWFCTGTGLAAEKDGQLVKRSTGNEKLDQAAVICMSEDGSGNLWFATMGSGVFTIGDDGVAKHFDGGKPLNYTFSIFHPDKKTTWLLAYKGLFIVEGDTVRERKFEAFDDGKNTYFHHCIADSKGNFWFGTKRKGVLKVSGKIEKHFKEINGLIDNEVWKIFEDREGNIWFGGKTKGLSMLPDETFELTNKDFGLPEDNVQSVYLDRKGMLWVGTEDGLYKSRYGNVEVFIDDAGSAINDINAIGEDREGNIYLVTRFGIKIINETETKVVSLEDQERMFTGYCLSIDEDEVLYGGVEGLGVQKGDFIEVINDSLGFPEVPVLSIIKDNHGIYWFATDIGLYSYDGEKVKAYTEKDGIATGKMRTIIMDNDGILWIGSSRGIYIYNGQQFFHLSEKDGLGSETIYSMYFDDQRHLWVGEPNGLDRIILDGFKIKEVRHYDPGRGFMANFCHNNAMCLDQKGRLLVGTDKGILTYNEEFDKINELESFTEITDIKLFSQPTNWLDYSDKLDARGYPINLELSYNQNYFTFDFKGICHRNPGAVKYKYKLEGMDYDWIELEDKNSAVYSNLDPGYYTFEVMSSNDEGIWNKESVNFSFTIHPPFWQTWWFYTSCFILFCIAVYSYFRMRRDKKIITESSEQLLEQNQIIEEKSHEILDSINYAKRIQEAILPSQFEDDLANSFVYYKPKDIVSGDFYWYKKVDGNHLLAAVDCTGHGVPGGFVSMVGNSGLNRAVNEYQLRKPGEILEKLSEFVVESFHDESGDEGIKDGMDAALCSINPEKRTVEFSGANNPLYIVKHNKAGDPELPEGATVKRIENLYEVKGDRRPVGASEITDKFATHTIQLEENDAIYFFTDGFPDQFGGAKGKKYMYKSFKKFLLKVAHLPMPEQQKLIAEEFESWRGEHEQVDDICIIGVKL